MSNSKYEYPKLILERVFMLAQVELYTCTILWGESSSRIVAEHVSAEIKRLRSIATTLSFILPKYGTSGGGISLGQAARLHDWLKVEFPNYTKAQLAIKYFLSERISAIVNYPVLQIADILRYQLLILRKNGRFP